MTGPRPIFGASGRLPSAGMPSCSERSDDPEMDYRSTNEPVPAEDSDAGVESGPDDGTGAGAATAAATAAVGGAVGGAAAALATGAGGIGVAVAGGAIGVAAGPVMLGGALVGAGTVLALKGLGVPVDEAAAKAVKIAKEAAAKAAPAVSKGVAEGASAVGESIAASVPSVGKQVAAGAQAAGAGIRRAIGHRKPDMEKAVSPHARRQLYESQQGRCNGCGNGYEPKDLTLDHIKPRSKGGGNETDNLQLLCHNCNSIKGNKTMDYLRDRLKET